MAVATKEIHFRIPEKTKALLSRAIAVTHSKSMTSYILEAAVQRARTDLAETRIFEMSEIAWKDFNTRLEAPPKEIPTLRNLLNSPSVFDGLPRT